MALNTCEMWSNSIKIAFFSKNYKKRQAAGGFAPRPPSVIRLNYSTLLNSNMSPNLNIFAFWLLVWALSLERVPSYVLIPGHGFWSSILRYLCPPQKVPLSKFLMTSLHVICGLPPPNQRSWLRLCRRCGGKRVVPPLAAACFPPFRHT